MTSDQVFGSRDFVGAFIVAFTVDDVAQHVSIVGVFYGGQDWESHLSRSRPL